MVEGVLGTAAPVGASFLFLGARWKSRHHRFSFGFLRRGTSHHLPPTTRLLAGVSLICVQAEVLLWLQTSGRYVYVHRPVVLPSFGCFWGCRVGIATLFSSLCLFASWNISPSHTTRLRKCVALLGALRGVFGEVVTGLPTKW